MTWSYNTLAAAIDAAPLAVREHWPLIEDELVRADIYSPLIAISAIATVRVETGSQFAPIHEFGGDHYLNRKYDARIDLGNTPELDGDGARYCGRGFIQLTGKRNYTLYSPLVGIDLTANPEAAMQPPVAARVFAQYFKRERVWQAAEARDWRRVRRLVNGGYHQLDQFLTYINRIEHLPAGDYTARGVNTANSVGVAGTWQPA